MTEKQISLLSDEELVERINSGDYSLFSELIDRLMPHIVAVAVSHRDLITDTENLIGEGTLAVFDAVKSYESGKSSFKTFACVCIDRAIGARVTSALAKKRIPDRLVTSIDDVEIQVSDNPESIVIRKEEENSLGISLKNILSELELNVLNLFMQGYSYSVISEKLGVTQKSVDGALRRIRGKLKR